MGVEESVQEGTEGATPRHWSDVPPKLPFPSWQ